MEVKLLGVHISDDLRWESHVNALYNNVSSRLHQSFQSIWCRPKWFTLFLYCGHL